MASTRYDPKNGSISSTGQLELLQHSNSTTDSNVSPTLARDDSTETIAGGASTASLHAVFNLDTGKVLDTVKETRELLDNKNSSSSHSWSNFNNGKPPKKPKKKISASWTTEWSEDAFEKKEPKTKGKLFIIAYIIPPYLKKYQANTCCCKCSMK